MGHGGRGARRAGGRPCEGHPHGPDWRGLEGLLVPGAPPDGLRGPGRHKTGPQKRGSPALNQQVRLEAGPGSTRNPGGHPQAPRRRCDMKTLSGEPGGLAAASTPGPEAVLRNCPAWSSSPARTSGRAGRDFTEKYRGQGVRLPGGAMLEEAAGQPASARPTLSHTPMAKLAAGRGIHVHGKAPVISHPEPSGRSSRAGKGPVRVGCAFQNRYSQSVHLPERGAGLWGGGQGAGARSCHLAPGGLLHGERLAGRLKTEGAGAHQLDPSHPGFCWCSSGQAHPRRGHHEQPPGA